MTWAQNRSIRSSADPQAPDFYFDSVSQVHLDRWSAGRAALIGDAAWAAGPGGNGTGSAVVAAYVLAGELAAAGGDHRAAFGRYEQLLRPYVTKGQKQARGSSDFLAPATARKIAQLQRFYKMLPYLPVRHLMKYLTTRTASGIKLPRLPPRWNHLVNTIQTWPGSPVSRPPGEGGAAGPRAVPVRASLP